MASVESTDNILNVKNYMFQTAYSIMASHLRKSRIVHFKAIDDLNTLNVTPDEPTPEDQAIHRQELGRLLDVVVALPEKVRQVFMMRRINDLSQREVAQELSIPESTVEMRMRRANFLITKSLSEDGNRPPDASMGTERLTRIRPDRDPKANRTPN
ncbi:hypothetical protein AEYBE204_13965 [Asticcacaulis sp. YBE204]|nr:hypothetical protein AEYBE204_13965 [Asticcacaulis sp. YBE204]